MSYCLIDKTTGARVGEEKHSLDELEKKIDSEIEFFVRSFMKRGNKSTIRRELRQLKERTQNLIFVNSAQQNNSSATVWTYLKFHLAEIYIDRNFGSETNYDYCRLIRRYSVALENLFVVHIADLEKLISLGSIFTSAKIYDSTISANKIILTQDQLNYLKLIYSEEDMILNITDVSAVLASLSKIGLEE